MGGEVSKYQRNKGAAAEREVCRLLSEELGIKVERTLDQARAGGADCIAVKGFAIEVKRREALSRPAWWAQAVKQGIAAQAEPMVFYRRSREPWQALIKTVDGYRVATWDGAMAHIREKLAILYGIYGDKK